MEGPLGLQFFVISKVLLWTWLYMVLLSWDYRSRIQESVYLSPLLGIAKSSYCVPFHTPTSCVWALVLQATTKRLEFAIFPIAVFILHFLRLLSEVEHGHLSVTCLCLSMANFLLDCWLFLTGLWASFYILNTNDL